MNSKHLIYADRAIGFVFVCIVAFATGITAKEIVWGLYISSVVSGVVALMLPIWVLLLFPSLDKKLFPTFEPPDFTFIGRIFAVLFLTAILIGPFLFFMLLFTPFLIEMAPIEGMPAADQPWLAFHAWAVKEFAVIVAIITILALAESAYRLVKLDNSAFFRPWALVLKMFAVVVVLNFGFATWTIIPLVAIVQFPEDFITRWGPKAPPD